MDGVQLSSGMISLLKEERTKKPTAAAAFYHPSNPPSVRSSATVAFPIEWVLVRDANVFMGDVGFGILFSEASIHPRWRCAHRPWSVGSGSGLKTLRMMGSLSG